MPLVAFYFEVVSPIFTAVAFYFEVDGGISLLVNQRVLFYCETGYY